MQKVVISEEERECISPFVERRKCASAAFEEASRAIYASEKALWKKMRELWPTASKLDHPEEGDWTVNICEPVANQEIEPDS